MKMKNNTLEVLIAILIIVVLEGIFVIGVLADFNLDIRNMKQELRQHAADCTHHFESLDSVSTELEKRVQRTEVEVQFFISGGWK